MILKMERYKIFVVEDDLIYGEMLKYYLSMNPDYEVFRFKSAKECLANMSKKPDLVTLDYSLPDGTGGEVMQKIRQCDSSVAIIMISGQKDISTAIELLKSGASDYLVKDDNTKDLLWNAIIRLREVQSLKKEVQQLKEELNQQVDFGKTIKGNSPSIQRIFGLVAKAANSSINVSITGETGTGKELVAKAVHFGGNNKKSPFVAVNMAAIPKDLIESELFGHEKGAFTGAIGRKIGKFEEANKGTLFLDEIAEMDLNLQSKILRVLQERELVRIGGNEKVKLEIRVITATHKNLADEVNKGTFREDLYYRLIGLPIDLPPLRERGNDILVLAKFFLDDFCRKDKLPAISISVAAKERLLSYTYPGNVRELKAAIELAAVMCNDNTITPDDITFGSVSQKQQLIYAEKTLKEFDMEIVTTFLKKYNNNINKVAEILDIGKSTIYRMLQEKSLKQKSE